MLKKIVTLFLMLGMLASLGACSLFSNHDNTPLPSPLTHYTMQRTVEPLWSVSTGTGTGDTYLQLSPAIAKGRVFTDSAEGIVTATNQTNGAQLWQIDSKAPLSTSPALGDGKIFLGTRDGYILALDQTQGKRLWKVRVPSQVLATPTAKDHKVFVKTIDGKLTTLNMANGKVLWTYAQQMPSLMLRGSGGVQYSDHKVITGFANGKLVVLQSDSGSLLWEKAIATPEGTTSIQRMVDIDATPLVTDDTIYVATYQGHIAAVNLRTGGILWQKPLSSYQTLAIMDNRIMATDATGNIWAFDKDTGTVDWVQHALKYRNLTGPVPMDNTLVLGDGEGYLHWLSPATGKLLARKKVDDSAINAKPVVSHHKLYVTTADGLLAAYKIT